ncbi:MAG: GNAT family N-acetyltransferase [Legionella sp.]|nr:GNAT family N-acetyltransferase [Legionella sp.]
MYSFIQAEGKHVEQLVPIMASTGYWDFGLKNNSLNMTNREFMRESIVKPYLPLTTIIVEDGDYSTVLGAVTCATKDVLSNMPASEYDKSIDPRIAELFKNIFEFELTDSYHISFLAVAKPFRGIGLGGKLLDYAENKAHQEKCETLSLYTVSCQTSAIKLYHRFGMMITKVIAVSDKVKFPNFLYFEKNKTLMTQHDYFDTEEYKQLDVNLLTSES